MPCIWCKREPTRYSVEHAIPEALGCPPALVLPAVACAPCNNGLAHIDQALLKQFEPMTFMLGVKRKKGRAPTIDSWQPLRGDQAKNGPRLFVNGGPRSVEVEGRILRAASKANGISNVWVDPKNGRAGFSQEFGNDPRFVPSLYKIGLNLIALYFGAGTAAEGRYDHVRAFVREDGDAPRLRVLMEPQKGKFVNAVSGPIEKPGRTYPMFRVTLLGISFLLDLDADQPGLRDIQGSAVLHGEIMVAIPPHPKLVAG